MQAPKIYYSDYWPLVPVKFQFFQLILKNYFTFKNQLCLQKHGTSVGTKMAPSYANIFMGYLEQSILFALPDDKKPFLWKIFMDEVFLIWTHGLKSLGIYKTFKLLSSGC